MEKPAPQARAFLLRLPVDDLEARGNLALLAEPSGRGPLVPDLIDELELDRLAPGIDAAIGEPRNGGGIDLAALGDEVDKPGLRLLHHLLRQSERLLVGRLEGARHRFQRAALHLLDLDA